MGKSKSGNADEKTPAGKTSGLVWKQRKNERENERRMVQTYRKVP